MTLKIIHVVSISSGKDSQATAELALERVGKENVRMVFCDTGNEDAEVELHLQYLEREWDMPIMRLKADFADRIRAKRAFIANDRRVRKKRFRLVDKQTGEITYKVRSVRWTNKAKRRALAVLHPTGIPFLDLCLWKGRFPSRKGQFCTEELKTNLLVEYQLELVDAGFGVVSWQGVRRDESENRKDAKRMQRTGPRLWQFRPIILWTAQQTVDFCLSRGRKLNQLYSEGFDRVGCMPCINCGKDEVNNIGLRRPEEIDRIAKWEWLVGLASKRGMSTFFPDPNRQAHLNKRGIHNIVRWAKTTRGGAQYDLLAPALADSAACSSSYGLCDRA